MKKCIKCFLEKPLTEFNKSKKNKDGTIGKCKSCKSITYIEKKGDITSLVNKIYSSQRASSRYRGHNNPDYTNHQLLNWIVEQCNFYELYNNRLKSGYKQTLTPSVDRLDDYIGYKLENIRLVTWEENRNKSYADRKNGINNKASKAVIGINRDTGERLDFSSAMQAHRILKINKGHISSCCNGNRKTAGGYFWRHKKD